MVLMRSRKGFDVGGLFIEKSYVPDADGIFEIPEKHVDAAMTHGLEVFEQKPRPPAPPAPQPGPKPDAKAAKK